MKICFFAPANNYHTKKWCKWFSEHGHEIHVVSFIKDEIPSVTVHFIDTGVGPEGGDASKLKYLLHSRDLKRIVDSIKPDIVNVHYATSYGTVAALSGIKPYVLSVWGSDIYDFPQKSPLHMAMLKYSLKKATWLFSTSKAMAEEGSKYTNKRFEITPFGVDMKLFNPDKRTRSIDDNKIIVGTVKGLSPKYGIEYILKTVAKVKSIIGKDIELRIAGIGPYEEEYKKLCVDLDICNITKWLGFISQQQAAIEWANMDIAIIPSTLESESFGVSAVEAQACGTATIISDVPGLMEATIVDETSCVVKRSDLEDLVEKTVYLINNTELRREMGLKGRAYVESNYEIDKCFKYIEQLYFQFFRQ